jgi:hypothetical protein
MEFIRGKACIKVLVLCFLICVFNFLQLRAQTFAEFYSQKKKQREYLLKQVAGLQIYIGYAKKGYDIMSLGMQTVSDIKSGEFGLHSAFFSSLKAINPVILNNTKIAEIITLQLAISKTFNGMRLNSILSDSDRDYIRTVRSKLLNDCLMDLEELWMIISYGKVEMTDDERIKRIDQVYMNVREKSAFTQSFIGEVSLFIGQKESEKRSINQQRRLYDTN